MPIPRVMSVHCANLSHFLGFFISFHINVQVTLFYHQHSEINRKSISVIESPGHVTCYNVWHHPQSYVANRHDWDWHYRKSKLTVKGRDHSFLRNMEFWAESRNLPTSEDFPCFHGILRNSVLAGDIGDKYSTFWWSSGRRTVCIHDFTMKYMTATRALTGGILKILSCAYPKYWQLIW